MSFFLHFLYLPIEQNDFFYTFHIRLLSKMNFLYFSYPPIKQGALLILFISPIEQNAFLLLFISAYWAKWIF